MKEQFVMPAKLRTISIVLLAIGILALIIGIFALGGPVNGTRFWIVLLFNAIFFLFMTLGSLIVLCAATLAQGSWHIAYRRVIEAVFMAMPVFAIIAFIIMMCIVWGDKSAIYQWADKTLVAHSKLLQKKSAFLNPSFYTILTVITLGMWTFFGFRIRRLSLKEDMAPAGTTKIFWKTYRIAALFIAFYYLTNATSTWQWIMSIDVDWYSTLFMWYIFASLFVSSIAVITLFVIILRNFGFLEWITYEHLHDMGKFMFAFSIFWMYLWFAQYLLIWYGNIPEETTYFTIRAWGSYHTLFYLNLIINFCAPFLILMTRDSKRNYTIVAYMAILVFIGHYLDFYLKFMPGPLKNNWHIGWYEVGITLGFIGLMILVVTRNLSKAPLFPKNHPYMKEAVIHQS